MKVTVENKKGLNKDLKILIDKETMNSYMDEKYEEIKGTVNLKGFRPGKVPKEVLKRQFGKAVFGEVLDKVIKDTSTKALEENKIKPAGQPKLDLKTYGEDKELEYVLSVTVLPKVDIKPLENIKFDQYSVKIDDSETDKRIKEIAKNQPNFKDTKPEAKAKEGDLVALDYKATVDGKEFKGSMVRGALGQRDRGFAPRSQCLIIPCFEGSRSRVFKGSRLQSSWGSKVDGSKGSRTCRPMEKLRIFWQVGLPSAQMVYPAS